MYQDQFDYDEEDNFLQQYNQYEEPEERDWQQEINQMEQSDQQDDQEDYSLGINVNEENYEGEDYYPQNKPIHHIPMNIFGIYGGGIHGGGIYGRTQEKIDNSVAPDYGQQMRINNIKYGILHKDHFYQLFDNQQRGYQFPNGGYIKFRSEHLTSSTLQISDGRYYKIDINIKQIEKIYDFKKLGKIFICYNFPPLYHVNSQKDFQHHQKKQGKQTQALLSVYEQFILQKMIKKPHWKPFWKRILNIPLHNIYETCPNQTFLAYLLIKNGGIFIQLQSYQRSMQILRKELFGFKQIQQIILQKQVLSQIIQSSHSQLLAQYSMKKFENYFDFPAPTKRNKIQKYQIMFSLISFLYTSRSLVGIADIFKMAQFVNKQIKQKGQNLYFIWKTIKYLTPSDIETNIKRNLFKFLEQKINITISKGKKEFTDDEINKDAITVPLFKITPSGLLPSGWSTDLRNRLVRHYKEYDYQFMKIQILDDNGEKGSFCMFDDIFRGQINRRMQSIHFLGRTYVPLGWTQSQLKTASMWFTLEKADVDFINREALLYFLGEFSEINNPALKGARIGQNLSTGFSVSVQDANVQMVQDKKSGKHLYTDGIGMISADLIEKIQKVVQKQSNATVFQVRFQGSKGLLALNRQLPPNTIILRKSMEKFKCPCKEARAYLDILDSNYYKIGYLNRQIILLLQFNGIQISSFIEIQRQYMQSIINLDEGIQEENSKNFEKNIDRMIYGDTKQQDEFKIQNIGEVLGLIKRQKIFDVRKQPILRKILCEKYRGMFEKLVKKSHIKVVKSARILGIIDQYDILKEDEVYCTIVMKNHKNSEEQIRKNIEGRVMLTRNPCMHPSDIRVVTCISKQQASKRFLDLYEITNLFENLPNCVIFPAAGAIPLTAQISGSDLDGDTFFITWDQRLVPKKAKKPYIADDIKPEERIWGGSGYPERIKFFNEFISNDNLGRIGNSHLAKADKEGAESPDCLKLCQAYNKAVDYPKKGYKFEFQARFKPRQYPHFMQKYDKKTYTSKTALGRVYNNAKDQFNQFVQKVHSKDIKIPYINKLLEKKYMKQEIVYAIDCILEFNRQIQKIMTIYGFSRESQIYALSKNKQNKDKLVYLSRLQLTFFQKFFRKLPIKETPENYYKFVRQFTGYLKGKTVEISPCVQSRLLLWYHITYYNSFKVSEKSIKFNAWLQELRQIQIQKNIRLREQVKYIGILWFVVPCLTFIFLKKHQHMNKR